MARKKKTPSDAGQVTGAKTAADTKDETQAVPETAAEADQEVKQGAETGAGTSAKAGSSKAGAISGAVKGAAFDTPDAAMADTSLDATDVAKDAEPNLDVVTVHGVVSMDEEVVPEPDSGAKPEPEPDLKPAPDAQEPDAPEVTPVPVIVQPAPKGSFFAPLLGGVLAAVIGFGGAIYFKAVEWPVFGAEQPEDVTGLITQQSERLAGMAAQIEMMSTQMQEAQAKDAEALSALNTRIDELPAPTVAPEGAEITLSDDLQATLDAQRAEVEALQEKLNQMSALAQEQITTAQAQQETAAEAEARARARGALNTVRAALSSGAGFASALPDIAAATDVPEALANTADSGVPTAAMLEAEFSAGARAALSASLKETAGDAPADRIRFFLKDQLGARSLTPREGDDPDAVLSRAEAAVRSGDLDAALTTIEALPEAGRAALDGWAEKAKTRRDALAAFDSLADALSAN